MLGPLADDRDHLGFVVELDRFLRPHDWLPMRHHRSQHAEKNRRKFRDVVALRAFLHMVEVVEAEANDLSRIRDRQRVFQSIEGTARGCRRFLRKGADRREVAVARRRTSARSPGTFASTACRSTTLSPSTTPSRTLLFASNPTIFMSLPPYPNERARPRVDRAAAALAQAHKGEQVT